MNFRVIKNLFRGLLCLPVYKTREEINAISIRENNDLLVEIIETDKLRVNRDPKTTLRKSEFDAITEHRIRKTCYEMLVRASELLPPGYILLVLEAYRPYDVQLARFDAKYAKLRAQLPTTVSDGEVMRRTRMGVADPRAGAPHQTGGAVDVAILDVQGNPIDMGTNWAEFNKKTPTKNWMYLTREQRKNRKMLFDAMMSVGFINYPGEWWHYSYGDRAWAVYTNRTECPYGSVIL